MKRSSKVLSLILVMIMLFAMSGISVMADQGTSDNSFVQGFDSQGFDKDGYDKGGHDKDGFDRNGHDKEGYDKGGRDKDGFDRNGHDRNGHDRNDNDNDNDGNENDDDAITPPAIDTDAVTLPAITTDSGITTPPAIVEETQPEVTPATGSVTVANVSSSIAVVVSDTAIPAIVETPTVELATSALPEAAPEVTPVATSGLGATEVIVTSDVVPQAAPALPKTGGLPVGLMMSLGGALTGSGLLLKRRK